MGEAAQSSKAVLHTLLTHCCLQAVVAWQKRGTQRTPNFTLTPLCAAASQQFRLQLGPCSWLTCFSASLCFPWVGEQSANDATHLRSSGVGLLGTRPACTPCTCSSSGLRTSLLLPNSPRFP